MHDRRNKLAEFLRVEVDTLPSVIETHKGVVDGPRDLAIFQQFYGIGCEPVSVEDIANEHDMEESSISPVLFRVRQRIKESLVETCPALAAAH